MKKVVLAVVALFAIFTFIQTYSAAQQDSASAALAPAQAVAGSALPN